MQHISNAADIQETILHFRNDTSGMSSSQVCMLQYADTKGMKLEYAKYE